MSGISNTDPDLEGLVNSLTASTQGSNTQTAEDDIPEKYRGKSVAEIIEMHRNAEREIGRLGHQLGEQRALVDVLTTKIDSKRRRDLGDDDEADEPTEPVKLTPEALLDDPEAVLEKWLRSKTKKRAGKKDDERVAQLEQRLVMQELAIRHPDYVEVSNSQEFVDWVKESPLRLMTAQAGAAGNVQAAIAVLDEFKREKGKSKSSKPADVPALERGGAGAPEAGTASRQKYSRRAIRALAERNPAKYNELLPQIRAAYERGDVINDL